MMLRDVRAAAAVVVGGAMLAAGVIVVNQTSQAVQLASTVHPALGTATLWALVAAYAAAVGVPVVLWARLPRPLVPPASEDDPAFAGHLERLAGRLRGSPHLAGRDLSGRAGVEAALGVLGAEADAIVRRSATTVFLATAASQAGRLDAILVLAAQSRMIWRVAHLYGQRPAPADLARLYLNVGATAFAAAQVEDVDLEGQVAPIIAAAMAGLGANVPGLQAAGTVVAASLLDGAANAFLTLRVGMIAKRHCAAVVLPDRPVLRRLATAEAAGLLGRIVSDGTARLTGALWKASAGRVNHAVAGASTYARDAGSRLWARLNAGRPGTIDPESA